MTKSNPTQAKPSDALLVERLWRLHQRGLSYASDKPCVNLLLADMAEGLKLAAEQLTRSSPHDGEVELVARAIAAEIDAIDAELVNVSALAMPCRDEFRKDASNRIARAALSAIGQSLEVGK